MLETEAPKRTVETKAVAVPKPTEQATAAGEPQPTVEAKAVEAPKSAGDGKEAHGEGSAEERELEPVEAADEDRDGEQGDVDDCARVDGDVKMEVHEEENAVEREVEPIRATDEHHENQQAGELEKIGVEEGGADAEHGCDKSEQDDVDAEQFWQQVCDEAERAEQLSQASSLLAYYAAMKGKRNCCWKKEQQRPSQRVQSKLCWAGFSKTLPPQRPMSRLLVSEVLGVLCTHVA